MSRYLCGKTHTGVSLAPTQAPETCRGVGFVASLVQNVGGSAILNVEHAETLEIIEREHTRQHLNQHEFDLSARV